ncbi:hypothetical protein MCUN1_001606 [Malassezia cuniculi]|uniref:Uncharacterized protein n=1 Tax=Malassezia cuniculi TaxID=948313 RepID=A0AAF0EXZ8_9BASI|nr:hypothetical protein MCUN1_001606 [Malassezia cuniculi]
MSESPAKGVNRPIPVPPRSRARQAARTDDGDTSIGEDKSFVEGLMRAKSPAYENLEKELAEKNTAHEALQKELSEAKERITALEKSLEDKTAAHDALVLSANEKESAYETLTQEASGKQEAFEALSIKLSERDAQLTEVARQLDTVSKEHESVVAELQDKLTQVEERAAALEKSVEDATRSHALAVEELNKEIDTLSSDRDEVTKRSALWIDELENLRAQHAELKTQHSDLTERVGSVDADERVAALQSRITELEDQLESERKRADAAEDRVRDLRFTAEESRRAIMRLQEAEARAKAGKEVREDDDVQPKHARRASLVGRAFSPSEEEDKPSGLRGLMLSGAATSPTIDANSPTMPQTREAPEEESAPQPLAAPVAISRPLSLFNTSILRPTFGLRKKGEEEPKAEPVDAKAEAAREAAKEQEEKDSIEINSLRRQIQELQDQLMESRESLQASEQCITSLRDYIVRSQSNAEAKPKRKVPPIPTATPSTVTPSTAPSDASQPSEPTSLKQPITVAQINEADDVPATVSQEAQPVAESADNSSAPAEPVHDSAAPAEPAHESVEPVEPIEPVESAEPADASHDPTSPAKQVAEEVSGDVDDEFSDAVGQV